MVMRSGITPEYPIGPRLVSGTPSIQAEQVGIRVAASPRRPPRRSPSPRRARPGSSRVRSRRALRTRPEKPHRACRDICLTASARVRRVRNAEGSKARTRGRSAEAEGNRSLRIRTTGRTPRSASGVRVTGRKTRGPGVQEPGSTLSPKRGWVPPERRQRSRRVLRSSSEACGGAGPKGRPGPRGVGALRCEDYSGPGLFSRLVAAFVGTYALQ